MSDGQPQQRPEGAAYRDEKPSIAEVAAWLRRAAEAGDGIEELRQGIRRAEPPDAASPPSPLPGTTVQEAPGPPADHPPDEPASSGEASDDELTGTDEAAAPAPSEVEPPVEAPHGPTSVWATPVDGSTVVTGTAVEGTGDGAPGDGAAVDEGAETPVLGTPPDDTPLDAPLDETLLDESPLDEVPVVEAPVVEGFADDAAAGEAPGYEAPAEVARVHEAAVEEPAGHVAALDTATATLDRDGGGAPPEVAVEDAPAGEEADEARPEGSVAQVVPPGSSSRLWSDQEDDPAAAPQELAADGAEAPAATGPSPEARSGRAGAPVPDHPGPDPEVPAVSDALARFASAVLRHNTAEVAAVKLPEEEPPKVEALVEDELPLAAGEEALADAAEIRDAEAAADNPLPARSPVASLFDLDLAELAARARSRAEERAAPPPTNRQVDGPEPEPPTRAFDQGMVGSGWRSSLVEAPDEVEADEEPVVTSGLDLPWDVEAPAEAEDGVRVGNDDDDNAAAAKPKAPLVSTLAAVRARRRSQRKRYPRGQLKERIGFLRRVRAMLGVVVLTVVLGVAAGAAIGAFLVFLAFAIRSAITSS